MNKQLLDKFAHDLRGPIHTAKLNLEAAQMLAQKIDGPNRERLNKHLTLVEAELEKLQEQVKRFVSKMR
ncbi:MAG: hypothetical protein ONA90_10665 [candidate division KSB1 bacterium]|nr:hypothetical protein [candidate division KSB1 bacterium]